MFKNFHVYRGKLISLPHAYTWSLPRKTQIWTSLSSTSLFLPQISPLISFVLSSLNPWKVSLVLFWLNPPNSPSHPNFQSLLKPHHPSKPISHIKSPWFRKRFPHGKVCLWSKMSYWSHHMNASRLIVKIMVLGRYTKHTGDQKTFLGWKFSIKSSSFFLMDAKKWNQTFHLRM